MGYRSDVGIALGFGDYNEADNFVTAYKIKEPEFWERTIKGVWGDAEPHILAVKYEDIKWHDGSDLVDGIYNMLEFATENYLCAWILVRVGDNFDDIETDTGHCMSSREDNGLDVAQDILSELNECIGVKRGVYVQPYDKLT